MKRVFFILFLCSFGQANVFSQYANIENDSLLVLGNKIYRTGDYVQSQKIYEQAISVHSKNPQSKEWIIAAIGLGASILDQGRILEGVSWIQKADSSITDSISLELQAYAKSNLGWATWWMGYSKKALPVYEQALNLANRSGDEYRIAQISNSLSLLSRFLGRYSDAILYAKKAHDYFEKINDPYLLNISKGNLLAAYDALGFVEKAETLLLEAINNKNDIGNSDLLSTNYQKLANLYLKKGEYDKSLVYQSKNLAIANNSVNPIEKILALKEIGNTYVLMREHLK
ncbi:MAG: tetratricopeptide repeat protein, partial [Balneola sp.]